MYRYQNNAFRVMGLPADSSLKDITQRVNEIRVKVSLGINVSYEFDFDWMGKVDRSEQNVINALQRLENPISRWKEEIFWFWIDTEADKSAVDFLTRGDRQSAHKLWKSVIESNISENKKVSALVNQMILSHSSVIGREMDLRYKEDVYTKGVCTKCNMQFGHGYRFCVECGNKLSEVIVENSPAKKRSIGLSETHWQNWRFAINRISMIAENEYFWERAKERAVKINDPRLSDGKMKEIRGGFLSDIASPNFRFLSQSLVSKDYERTKQHAALLNGSSFSYEYLRRGFNEILASHITLIDRHCKNSAKDIAEFKQSEQKTVDAVVDIYSTLEKNVSATVEEGNLVDFNCISDYGLARDKLAGNVKNMAIVLNNFIVDHKQLPPKNRILGYQKAHEMVKKAIEYAASQYTKQKFVKDEELVKKNMEVERLNRNLYEQTNSSTANSTVYKSQTSTRPSTKQASGTNWKPIVGWILAIGFIVIVSNLSENSSNKSKPSSGRHSSYRGQSSSSSAELYQLKTRIESLAATIKQEEARLLISEDAVKSSSSKLEDLESEINRLKVRVDTAGFGSDALIDEYNRKVNAYNDMLVSHNSLYSEYKTLYDSYKQDVSTHDALVESYNNKIR